MSYVIENKINKKDFRESVMQSLRFLLLLLCSVALANSYEIYSQNAPRKASREEALGLFEKKDYSGAYAEFSILLRNFSKDPVYKYYAGVCLVRMEMSPDTAAGLLQDAVNGSLDIRNIPDDAWFYLARAEQMAGRFPDAINTYGVFMNKAGKKTSRDYNVRQYIQECNEGKGKIRYALQAGAGQTTGGKMGVSEAAVKPEVKPEVKPDTQFRKLPPGPEKQLGQALDYQVKADSFNKLSDSYKKEYDRLTPSQKSAAKNRISEAETQAARYQKLADEKLSPASRTGIKDTAKTVKPSVGQVARPLVSEFDIITDPVKIRDQVIKIDPDIPSGLIYRIQMGVFSKPIQSSFFKGLVPVMGFRLTSGSIRYFAGMFRTSADAGQALVKVKRLGFKDSFITAVLDGKPVSIERAAFLEKEWGQKPLKAAPADPQTKVESGPETLIFRVEVTKSARPLKEEAVAVYRRVTGNQGLDILQAGGDSTAYVTGKFITFESAAEYASLLNRNGYRDAKVVAYIGTREIPVETAKKLYNESQ